MKIALTLKPSFLWYLLMGLVFSGESFAVCSPIGGDANMGVAVSQNLLLGKLTPPDVGSAAVTISAHGVRTVPANLLTNSQNQAGFGDTYQVAAVNITGSPDCNFSISVSNISPRITSVYLSSTNGTLSSGGAATIYIGASVSVNSTDVTSISGSFSVDVLYVP